MATTAGQAWWTIGELSARWHVSADSIRRDIAAGALKAMKVRGVYRIHQSVIDARERGAVAKANPERRSRRAGVKLRDLIGDLSDE